MHVGEVHERKCLKANFRKCPNRFNIKERDNLDECPIKKDGKRVTLNQHQCKMCSKSFSHSDDLKKRRCMMTMKIILNKVNQLKVQRKKCGHKSFQEESLEYAKEIKPTDREIVISERETRKESNEY